ncbi:MAG: TonB-dependent receptor [Gammaproteobacteria bacterium]|nr:TonB-dependent receptor [Gammaproteobacteria bacterium]
MIKFDYAFDPSLRLGFGYGRKTRSPLYLERYLWIPLEVNSGLGDFNNYVGNPDLEPETSDQLEVSLDWTFDNGHLAPRVFDRSIDDYIQGVTSTDPLVNAVSGAANGDPTPLQFANVEAELYGFDIIARYQFADNWRLDATLNFVRGKRTDISDNLFRIAPLNGRLALTAELGDWSFTTESVLVASQDKISRAIVTNEPRSVSTDTPGYGIVNFYSHWRAADNLSIRFGVENVFDKTYANHLSGFNRVDNSSVPVGARIPGAGVNVFGQLQVSW